MLGLLLMTTWAQTQAPPKRSAGAVPAGFDGSAYAKARELPARIMSFTAEPSSIQPGQSVILTWATENPVRRDDRSWARPSSRQRKSKAHSGANDNIHPDGWRAE